MSSLRGQYEIFSHLKLFEIAKLSYKYPFKYVYAPYFHKYITTNILTTCLERCKGLLRSGD